MSVDYRSILRKYMSAVLADDPDVGVRCADYNFDGTPEESAVLWLELLDFWEKDFQEYFFSKPKRRQGIVNNDKYDAVTEALKDAKIDKD